MSFFSASAFTCQSLAQHECRLYGLGFNSNRPGPCLSTITCYFIDFPFDSYEILLPHHKLRDSHHLELFASTSPLCPIIFAKFCLKPLGHLSNHFSTFTGHVQAIPATISGLQTKIAPIHEVMRTTPRFLTKTQCLAAKRLSNPYFSIPEVFRWVLAVVFGIFDVFFRFFALFYFNLVVPQFFCSEYLYLGILLFLQYGQTRFIDIRHFLHHSLCLFLPFLPFSGAFSRFWFHSSGNGSNCRRTLFNVVSHRFDCFKPSTFIRFLLFRLFLQMFVLFFQISAFLHYFDANLVIWLSTTSRFDTNEDRGPQSRFCENFVPCYIFSFHCHFARFRTKAAFVVIRHRF